MTSTNEKENDENKKKNMFQKLIKLSSLTMAQLRAKMQNINCNLNCEMTMGLQFNLKLQV